MCQRQPESRNGNGKSASPGITQTLLILIIVMTVIRLFQVAGSATAMVYFNVYMDRQLAVSTAMIGLIAAIGRLTGVPTALLTPRLVRRYGDVSVILAASLVGSLALLPMALVEHWIAAALGFVGAPGSDFDSLYCFRRLHPGSCAEVAAVDHGGQRGDGGGAQLRDDGAGRADCCYRSSRFGICSCWARSSPSLGRRSSGSISS